MPLVLKYEIEQNLVTARAHGQILREVNRGVLERWRDRYLPLHFQGGATGRYGYRTRSARYLARKRKKLGHTIPNVYTGESRDKIQKNVKITATRNGGRLYSKGRRFSDRLGGMPAQMRSEIEKLIPRERAELSMWAVDEYIRLAAKPEYKRKRKRKGKGA